MPKDERRGKDSSFENISGVKGDKVQNQNLLKNSGEKSKQRKSYTFTEDNKQISLKTRAPECVLSVKACWLRDSVPSPSTSVFHTE